MFVSDWQPSPFKVKDLHSYIRPYTTATAPLIYAVRCATVCTLIQWLNFEKCSQIFLRKMLHHLNAGVSSGPGVSPG